MKENREELEARIAAYIDGQLPPADAARLEVFLANTDPALAQQVIGMISDRNAVRAIPKTKAPDDLAARIMEQVERTSLLNDSEHFSAPHRAWWQSRAAMAAALFLILGGFSTLILRDVLRPNSPWRETVMDGNSPRRELAAAPAPLAETKTESIAGAGQSIMNLDSVKSTAAAQKAVSAAPAAITPPTATAAPIAAAQPNYSEPAPIQLTLVARDDQDYTRLRTELNGFASTNTNAPHDLIATNTLQSPESQAKRDQPYQFGAAQNTAGQISPNNSNSNEQLAARAARSAAPGESAVAKPSNADDQQPLNAPVGNVNVVRGGELAPAQYRASLRPDQLRKLASDFQLQTTAQDRTAVSSPNTLAGAIGGGGFGGKDLSDLAKDKSTSAWIDCIITLLPPLPPAAAVPSTEPATQR